MKKYKKYIISAILIIALIVVLSIYTVNTKIENNYNAKIFTIENIKENKV
jgi:hypothetical protein